MTATTIKNTEDSIRVQFVAIVKKQKQKQEWTQPIFIKCFREYSEFAKHITNIDFHIY